MKVLLSSLFLFLTSSLYAQQVEITSYTIYTDANGNWNRVNLKVEISGVIYNASQTSNNQVKSLDPNDLQNNLAITFTKFTNTLPILNSPQLSSSNNGNSLSTNNVNPYFYWDYISNGGKITSSQTSATTFANKITYNINIYSNTNYSPVQTFSDILTIGDQSKAGAPNPAILTVGAQFVQYANGTYADPVKDATSYNTKKTTDVQQIFSSPDAAPVNFKLTSTNKSLVLSWEPESVDYTPTSNPAINQTPSKVLIMVFTPDAVNVPLDAFVAGNSSNYTEDTSCFFNSNFQGGGDCISCSSGNTSWISDKQSGNAMIQSFSLQDNNGSYTITGLTPDETYTVAIQYQRGVQQECLQGTPIQTFSLTEANGGDEARQGDPRCFIVSAAYGSPLAKDVDIFRWGRDHILERTKLGHDFVEFYYNHSQPFADLIKVSPFLQVTVRTLLYPIAFFLYALQESLEYPWLSLLGCLMLCASVIWIRRRKFV